MNTERDTALKKRQLALFLCLKVTKLQSSGPKVGKRYGSLINVPHIKLAEVKGHQNWVQALGDYFIFPGGGTQFTHSALHYIDFIQQTVSDIAWGKQSRVILNVGCGVATGKLWRLSF